MTIVVISDTHYLKDKFHFPKLLEKDLKAADLIIHAGDIKIPKVLNYLKERAPLLAVQGNGDNPAVKSSLKEKEIIILEGYKIGVCHGHGLGKNTFEGAYEFFSRDGVDIIIFGHSHQPIIKTYNKVLMLNPGSPSTKRSERWFSYALLELQKDSIEAKLKFFQRKE